MSAAQEPQGSHFWFMTIQTANAAGYYLNSYQGTWTPVPGETRLDVFNAIRRFVEEKDPRCMGGVATVFDVQPNTIEAAR